MRVLAFSASLRKGSFNSLLIKIASNVARDKGCSVDLITLSDFDIPLYNGDIEENDGIPKSVLDLKKKMEDSDCLIISSPEYNYSVPGVLKNIIDWVSRAKPQPFKGKNILLMSASPSMVGGNRGLWALRIPLEGLGAFVYPEMFSLCVANEAFDPSGNMKAPARSKSLADNVEAFIMSIGKK